MSERKYVSWSLDELGIVTLTINNPPMNVLSSEVANELRACAEEIASNRTALVVIVTGAGEKAFMAGADIKEFPDIMKPRAAKVAAEGYHAAYNAIDFMPQPTIAAINGYALGGGLELALACDMRMPDWACRK